MFSTHALDTFCTHDRREYLSQSPRPTVGLGVSQLHPQSVLSFGDAAKDAIRIFMERRAFPRRDILEDNTGIDRSLTYFIRISTSRELYLSTRKSIPHYPRAAFCVNFWLSVPRSHIMSTDQVFAWTLTFPATIASALLGRARHAGSGRSQQRVFPETFLLSV